jgi:HTH-type transcriptional regulator/antitoxin HigA
MEIKPIRNDRDHEEALREIERLWRSKPGTPKGDRLDILIALTEAYESTHFPIDLPDPIEAIRFRLAQQAADYGELVGVIGTRTRVYEVMKGDRALSLTMIRRLHARLKIPAEVLIQPVRLRKAKRVA